MPAASSCSSRFFSRSKEAGSLGSASAYVTHSSRRFAILSSTGRVLVQALHQAPAQRVVRHAAASDAHDAELFRQEFDFREIVQRRDHQPAGQIAGDTEDHKGAGLWRLVGLEVCHERLAVCLTILGAFCGDDGSLWPSSRRVSPREFFPRTYVPAKASKQRQSPAWTT